jgi:crossover junction endodeoxyribonuclease RusA
VSSALAIFEIDVPMMRRRTGGPLEPPLSANDRWHYTQRAQRTTVIRLGVRDAARKAGIPASRHLTVTLHYAPGDNRRRDEDNLVPTLKAACDALARGPRRTWIGLELVPDDTPQYMTKRMPVIHPGPGERRLWLEVEVQQP